MTERELAELLRGNPELVVEDNWGHRAELEHADYSQFVVTGTEKPKRQSPEHDLQVRVFTEYERRSILRPEYSLIFAIPNGGHRFVSVAEKLKAEGVKAGVLDYMIPVARHGYHGAFVELKCGDNKPTQLQLDWLRNLKAEGYLCKVFWDSYEEIIGWTEWYLEKK